MIGIKQKYQVLFFQTEETVNRKKSGFRAAPQKATVIFFDFLFMQSIHQVDMKNVK